MGPEATRGPEEGTVPMHMQAALMDSVGIKLIILKRARAHDVGREREWGSETAKHIYA